MTNIVLGGGAAGIFSAIRCKELNPFSQVIVLEKTNQLLSKVRISGGGRCNVTHACFDPFELVQNYPRGSKELLGPFHHFQPKDTVAWFEERGVALKTESDGRIFPKTNSSETIINCLMQAAQRAGVDIRKQQHVQSIKKTEEGFLIELEKESMIAKQMLLATGSSPWGHAMAKQFGHAIVRPIASLFTFNVPTSTLLDLSGISLPDVVLTLKETGHTQRGPLLLTHWGFSGPAVLKLSAWAASALYDLHYKATLLINWTASSSQEDLYQSLLQQKKNHPHHTLPPLLPNHLFTRLMKDLNVSLSTPMNMFSNKTLYQVAAKLSADPYTIDGKTTYKQEFVTAGGIDLKEVDFKTLQSRKTEGLFFAGEILNIDGITGGFNFQNAWTTGWLAGTAMAAKSGDYNLKSE